MADFLSSFRNHVSMLRKSFFITKCVSETKRFTIISLSVSALHTWDNNYKLKSQKYKLLLESSYL